MIFYPIDPERSGCVRSLRYLQVIQTGPEIYRHGDIHPLSRLGKDKGKGFFSCTKYRFRRGFRVETHSSDRNVILHVIRRTHSDDQRCSIRRKIPHETGSVFIACFANSKTSVSFTGKKTEAHPNH